MAITIAVSGKGGCGKTTLSSLIIRVLAERKAGSILAIDADPNSCLAMTLGVEVTGTIAGIREEARSKTPDGGMDRVRTFQYGIQQALTEARGFDLLTMGHPEGPSCYCAANNLLRQFMDDLSETYGFVVLDNEAGMEHLSRRTTNNVDLLCIIAEANPIGEMTARRISGLADTLPIEVKQAGVIWNRAESKNEIDGATSLGYVPFDQAVLDVANAGDTIFDLPSDSPALLAVRTIIENLLESKTKV
jgi:CO dehydrogenase maturation factor